MRFLKKSKLFKKDLYPVTLYHRNHHPATSVTTRFMKHSTPLRFFLICILASFGATQASPKPYTPCVRLAIASALVGLAAQIGYDNYSTLLHKNPLTRNKTHVVAAFFKAIASSENWKRKAQEAIHVVKPLPTKTLDAATLTMLRRLFAFLKANILINSGIAGSALCITVPKILNAVNTRRAAAPQQEWSTSSPNQGSKTSTTTIPRPSTHDGTNAATKNSNTPATGETEPIASEVTQPVTPTPPATPAPSSPHSSRRSFRADSIGTEAKVPSEDEREHFCDEANPGIEEQDLGEISPTSRAEDIFQTFGGAGRAPEDSEQSPPRSFEATSRSGSDTSSLNLSPTTSLHLSDDEDETATRAAAAQEWPRARVPYQTVTLAAHRSTRITHPRPPATNRSPRRRQRTKKTQDNRAAASSSSSDTRSKNPAGTKGFVRQRLDARRARAQAGHQIQPMKAPFSPQPTGNVRPTRKPEAGLQTAEIAPPSLRTPTRKPVAAARKATPQSPTTSTSPVIPTKIQLPNGQVETRTGRVKKWMGTTAGCINSTGRLLDGLWECNDGQYVLVDSGKTTLVSLVPQAPTPNRKMFSP